MSLPRARPGQTNPDTPGLVHGWAHPQLLRGLRWPPAMGMDSCSQEPGGFWRSDVYAAQVCASCGEQGIPVIPCPALFPLFILTVTGSNLALPAPRQAVAAKLLPLLHPLRPAVVKHN